MNNNKNARSAQTRRSQQGQNRGNATRQNPKAARTEGAKTQNNRARRQPANPKRAGSTQRNEFQNALKVIPLGGLNEIGKNMTAFEYGNDIIIVDCGLIFPEGDMLGIDYVIPDITYLEENRKKIRGIFLTHGHEDHIGALPYVLKKIKAPIYSARLTIALVEHKLEEHGVKGIHLNTVRVGQRVKRGCFEVTFHRVCHSIADAMAIAIKTPVGVVVNTGDFKIDHSPLSGMEMDLAAFAKLGEQGVMLMMSDSTNSNSAGYTMSEQKVVETFENCFDQAKGRIFVATFSSNVDRVQQIVNVAESKGRKVHFTGRSMQRYVEISTELGYLKMKPGTLVDDKRLDWVEPEEIVIVTTGSQGEPMSGLVRMASQEHRTIDIHDGDMVIISASPIPGNEKAVADVIDKLFQCGATVIYEGLRDVHVSGHARQEEQKMMIALLKPKYFMPIHGEYRHLAAHANTAEQVGIPKSNIIVASNGDVLEFSKNNYRKHGTVPAEGVLVDGSGIGDVGNAVLRDRRLLSEDGLLVAIATVDSKARKISARPEVVSRGFVYVRENEHMMNEVRKIISNVVEEHYSTPKSGDFGALKGQMRSQIRGYLYKETKRNPMILPIIIDTQN